MGSEPIQYAVAFVPRDGGGFVAYSDYTALREQLRQAEQDRDEARREVVRVRAALNQIAWPASHGLRLETIESLQHVARDTLAILWAPSAIAALSRCKPASGGESKP